MPSELPTEITRRDASGRIVFQLPLRNRGGVRSFAIFMFLFGLAFIGVFEFAMSRDNPRQNPNDNFASLLQLLQFIFVSAGAIPTLIGLNLLLPSRSVITLDDDSLQTCESIGLIRWRRRAARQSIHRLVVKNVATYSSNGKPGTMYALLAQTENSATKMSCGYFYPKDLLLALAETISAELGKLSGATLIPTPIAVAVVEEAPPPDPLNKPTYPRPEKCQVEFIANPDGCTLMVPPSGFRGTSRSMLLFSLIWNAMIIPITAAAIFAKSDSSSPKFYVFLFLIPFWAAGIGTFLTALQWGRQKAVILATAQDFVFTLHGPVRRKEKTWPRANLQAIRVDVSNVQENHRSVMQLQMIFRGEKRPFGCFTGRDLPELCWIAAQLRTALSVPART